MLVVQLIDKGELKVQGKSGKWIMAPMAALLLAGFLTACSSDQPSGKTANSLGAALNGDPITLKVEIFDRGNAPAGAGPANDNFWTQWIQKNFGDPNHIRLEFVSVPRNQEIDKLNILMATGDAPDIVFTYSLNTIHDYIQDNGIAELDSLIDQYGPNLKKFLGEEVLNYGVIDGVQYTIPAKRPLQHMQATYIRKDWLDKLGLPVPTTTEQFYATMKAFKEKDPGQAGNKLIPYDFSTIYDSPIANPMALISSFTEKISEEDFYALSAALNTPELAKPGYKEGVRFLNRMNAEGLINPDFAIDKDGKQFERAVIGGYVGAFTALAAHQSLLGKDQVFDMLKKNVPSAEYVAMDPFTDQEGNTPKVNYDPVGMQIFIPKTSKHAAQAIQYLDWMSREDVLFMLQNGIEDKHYTIADGIPRAITTDEASKTFYNNNDIAIISNGKDFGSLEKNIEAVGYQFPEYKELAEQTIRFSLKDGYTNPRFDRAIEREVKVGETLIGIATEVVVKSILSRPEQFDAVYDNGVQEYLNTGGQAIIDERRAAYHAMNK